jgi:flavodoxin I
MANILIIFSSIGGNTELVTKKVATILESKNHKVAFNRVDNLNPNLIFDYDLTILASPTYNQGTLEDQFKSFISQFRKFSFENKNFAVIGLGDTKYYPEYLTESAGILEKEVTNQKGKLVCSSLRIGTNPLKFLDTLVLKWSEKVSSLV